MAIRARTPWTVGGKTYPADTVLGIRQRAFLDGDREFRVLFEPAPRRAIQTFFWSGECFVLGWLDDLCSVHVRRYPDQDGAKSLSLVCPLSAPSSSGLSTISIRNPTATYSPSVRCLRSRCDTP